MWVKFQKHLHELTFVKLLLEMNSALIRRFIVSSCQFSSSHNFGGPSPGPNFEIKKFIVTNPTKTVRAFISK